MRKSKFGLKDPISGADLVVTSFYPKFTIHDRGEVLDYLKSMNDPEKGMKYDGGKNIAGVLFEDFPKAMDGISSVATFGAAKYARSSWQAVPNATQRYRDALVRHQIAQGRGEKIDPESQLPHSWHIAWNALALIELEDDKS